MKKETAKSRRPRVLIKRFYRQEDPKSQLKNFFKKSLLFTILTLFTLSISGLLLFSYFYYQYEPIITNRISSGFWKSRAGIYSAPREFIVGQKIEKNELVSILRKAGYVENEEKNSFWNGSFSVEGNKIKIKSNDSIQDNLATIEIENNKIVKILNEVGIISAFEIHPQMLTGRTETKRSPNMTLKYEQIPENLKNAILVTEDRRFFNHFGIDPKGILRAFVANFTNRRIVQGGSTLTQQLVKNTFLSNKRTFSRKFSEAFLAIALENNMSKEDIFTLYCNEVYLGQYGISGIHGFKAASLAYFDKDLQDITNSEAATLAAIIRSPNRYSLKKNRDILDQRRDLILNQMLGEGYISQTEAELAKNEKVIFVRPKADTKAIAPYFVDTVIKELPKKIIMDEAHDDDNLRVYTTLDPDLQQTAENAVNQHLEQLSKTLKNKKLKPQATLVALNPKNGHVLAMVGGNDYSETQFNRATQAKRQPGSTFKPFVYATALERGIQPTKVYTDKPTTFTVIDGKPYQPSNYGGYYAMKEITMKTALAKSSNVVAVEVGFESGFKTIANKSEEFGFEDVHAYPSTALGTSEVTPLQLAVAYSSFANLGKKVEPVFIKKIQSGDGSLIYQPKPVEEQIISEETAFMITDMLQAVVERGTARKAKNVLGKDVVFAGKTGSSNDGWFVGYTPNLVCVVWVGFDENEDIKSTGGETALPLWTSFMKQATAERPEFGGSFFTMPRSLVTVKIDPETGMPADSMCPASEFVVAPKRFVSNIKCFKHQKLPETILAETVIESEIIAPPIEIKENKARIEETKSLISKIPEKIPELKPTPVLENKPETKGKTSSKRLESEKPPVNEKRNLVSHIKNLPPSPDLTLTKPESGINETKSRQKK